MQLARWLALLLVACWLGAATVFAESAPQLESGKACRGVAVLSSSIGHDVPLEEIETFVTSCRIDFVVVDFAWITYHWSRTDLQLVQDLAQRLRRKGIVVAAMYRPRLLRPDEPEVHVARDENDAVAADHNELCLAWPDSVEWASAWGEKILVGCPSIDHVVLYNLRTPCRCAKCADGAGAKHADAFLARCRERWTKTRPAVRIGHVGVGVEYADRLDFVCPFLPVNREDAASAVDATALADAASALRSQAPGKAFVPLAKVCWENATSNTTEDVASVIRVCDEKKLGFLLWTYEWIFHSEDGRYDADALVRALGADPAGLARFLHAPLATAARPDGRQWVYFDSRETKTAPKLVLVAADGHESAIDVEADAGLIGYLAERNWGRLQSLAVNLADTNRFLLRFPAVKAPFQRAELRMSMHLSETPPNSAFEVAVHDVTQTWEETAVTWSRAPSFIDEPIAVVKLDAKDAEVRIDVTPAVRASTSKPRANHGLLLKIAHPIPALSTPIARTGQGAGLIEKAIARWSWATTIAAALDKARAQKRLLLAVVVAGDKELVTPHEQILFSTVLAHPAVIDFVAEHFVPVRVELPAWKFAAAETDELDPLKELGTRAPDAGAPALVVAKSDETCVATLASLGTFDHALIVSFLRRALAKAGGPKIAAEVDPAKALAAAEDHADRGIALMRLGRCDDAVKELESALASAGRHASEASYWLAALLQDRDAARCREILTKLAGGDAADPWVAKAAMRLAWPVQVAAHECLVDPTVGTQRRGETTPDAAVVRAIDFLIREQHADGGWPIGDPSGEDFRAGVTVLAAHALFTWSAELDGGHRELVAAALRKADAWLESHVAKAPARETNSFAAAYYVEYLLDRLAAKRASRDEVLAATKQLVGGLCPCGAWSYSRSFGENWQGNERTHSVNTALGVAALERAKSAGLAIDDTAFAGALKALVAMRKGPGAYTYIWPGEPNFDSDDASIARAPLCDLALLRAGRVTKADVRGSVDVFLKYRNELHAVGKTSTPYWLPPHGYTSYFFHFAYYHAAQALAELGDAPAKRDLATLRDDLLGWIEPDGTWVDDLHLGKSYGTAATLLTLHLTGVRLRK